MGTRCPQCHSVVESVCVRVEQRDPRPGDLIVCMRCGAITVAEHGGVLHVMRPAEAFLYDPMLVLRAIAASDAVHARLRRH